MPGLPPKVMYCSVPYCAVCSLLVPTQAYRCAQAVCKRWHKAAEDVQVICVQADGMRFVPCCPGTCGLLKKSLELPELRVLCVQLVSLLFLCVCACLCL